MKLTISIILFFLMMFSVHANPVLEYHRVPIKINIDHYNSESLTCLTKAIYFEANTEPRVGMYAVAEVILNRVRSHRFPNSICEVVKQRTVQEYKLCQFSFYCDGKPEVIRSQMMYRKCKEIALLAILNQDKQVTYGATHYHATYVTPYWAKKLKKTVQIGQHIFYREG